jgi:hypothetical protein
MLTEPGMVTTHWAQQSNSPVFLMTIDRLATIGKIIKIIFLIKNGHDKALEREATYGLLLGMTYRRIEM